ncbi:SAG-related sequence [Besnoitia besnoiti]|uniref:SAG-related sequence n=1 Tax=Besnoitia besnoiti TaxID=94643 RepID=A0A2A9MKJ8_BESBE|nr:SAG-related sequence [Besnoitia besnoiti]PFH36811.1 SAG-related sequence [Besnoitia besnoiti]
MPLQGYLMRPVLYTKSTARFAALSRPKGSVTHFTPSVLPTAVHIIYSENPFSCKMAPLRPLQYRRSLTSKQGIPKRGQEQKSFSASGSGIAVVALFASVLMVCLYSPFPVSGVFGEEQLNICKPNGNRTVCSCENKTSGTHMATISAETNELQVNCQSSMQLAPNGLKNSTVCPMTVENISSCKAGAEKDHYMDLNTLLNGDHKIQWTDDKETKDAATSKILIVPPEILPYVDGTFAVGCALGEETQCKVAVTVAARATATTNNKIACAYGKDSNKRRQIIRLSPSQNTFTLDCGEKGALVQKNYKETYCPVSKENVAVPSCSEKYKTIFPGYQQGWWTSEADRSFTLTIPKDMFPANETSLMIQCQQKPQITEAEKAAKDEPQSRVCSVDVTIERGEKSNSVRPSVAAAATGAFLLGSGILPWLGSLI